MILNFLLTLGLASSVLFYLLSKLFIKGAIKAFKVDYKNSAYEPDELITKENIKGSVNRIFETKGTSKSVVECYVISLYNKRRVLMLKYHAPIKDVFIKINLYSKNRVFLDTYLLKETTELDYSSQIDLPLNCAFVNLELIDQVDDTKESAFNIRAKRIKKEQISLLQTYAFFSILFPIAYMIIFLLDSNYVEVFFNLANAIFILAVMAVFTLINFVVISRKYTKKTSEVGDKS